MKLFELKSTAEVVELERQLDDLMRPVGLDVTFSRHFVERLLGREKPVTIDEVRAAFEKLKRKFKNRLLRAKKEPSNVRRVLQDFDTNLNILFAVVPDPQGGFDLANITIKRKDPSDFRTNTPSGDVSGNTLQVGTRR